MSRPKRRSLGDLVLDVEPLRTSRSYRVLWIGQLVSLIGSQLRVVAVPYQVYLLTGSPLAVGLLGLFQAVPLIALSLWGGAIADAMDRRRLLLVTQVGLATTSVALAVTTQLSVASVPILYVLTALGAAFAALDWPVRASLLPSLVERRQIQSAINLNQILYQFSWVAGPALAGVLIAGVGLASAYWVDAGSFVVALGAAALLRATPPRPVERQPVVRAILEGIRYLGARRVLLSMILLDFLATFFGSPRALLPYYADQVFHVGPAGLGLLYASIGAGALVMTLASGWTKNVRRHGIAIVVAVAVYGSSIASFGLLGAQGFVIGLALLSVSSAANAVSAFFRLAMLAIEVPDRLRGRVNSINVMFGLGGPQLGQFESGVVAALATPAISVVSGGLACVAAAAAIGAWIPDVRRYRSAASDDPPQV